jgi:hypothetical protein
MVKLGPHSRPGKLAIADGRTAEAQLMKRVRDDLAQHCGGKPSATQKMIIAQCAMLTLRIHLMDRAALQHGEMTTTQAKNYLCWTNSLSRLLKQLGMKGTAERPATITEIMSRPRSVGVPPSKAA